jgi:hypothetical protein
MMRPIVLAFALSLASSVQAMPLAPLQQPDDMVVPVREGCGAGYQMVAGRCVRNTAVRSYRRCAAGLRLVNGRCIR